MNAKRTIFVVLGWIALGIGFVGIFLPVLPTTPFVILAAYFFSKGSERLHQWLLDHKWFGKPLREWERHGVVRPKGKIMATVLVIPSNLYVAAFTNVPVPLKITMICVCAAVLAFVWTRPSKPPAR